MAAAMDTVKEHFPVIDVLLEEVPGDEFVTIAAYMLTAIFTARPKYYGRFLNLLAGFQPIHEGQLALLAQHAPEVLADSLERENAILIDPRAAERLTAIQPN